MRFLVDGKEYNVLVTSLHRSAKVTDSKLSAKTKSGELWRDMVGTYVDYEMEIATDRLSAADYDDLFETLSSPVASHSVALPYGRAGNVTFDACISAVEDDLITDRTTERVWGGLSVRFKAKRPQRRATK